jgi:hypothetical protein
MKPDRLNYEIWLIDWLDGNLSDQQIEQLHLFFDQNPDLREEYDDMSSFILKPSGKSFEKKDQLKKSTGDLSGSQFEYLCIADLENDLSSGQKAELNEIIDRYPEKKRTFEIFQKMKLTPADISYEHKRLLFRRTAGQKVIRLSVIGLSAAATIALIITTYTLVPRNLPGNTSIITQNIVTDSILQPPVSNPVTVTLSADKKTVPVKQQKQIIYAGVQKINSVITQSDSPVYMQNDSLYRNASVADIHPGKVPVFAEIDLKGSFVNNTLVASNSGFVIPEYDDERSKLSKFIAKTFREKLLKENTSKDSPLKGYEIAEAGVAGLNKLLGWEMALDKKNDENGELRSVYFSSKILKFNAPVKKTEPLP